MGGRGRGAAACRHRRPRCALRSPGALGLIAVDTNILVYAHRRQAPQHEAALAELREVAAGRRAWGLPVFVVGEFVRIVTHPRAFDYPSSLEEALAALRGLLASRRARLLTPGRRYWSILQEVVVDGHATGNHMFDAQIAAVCLEHGADTILTEDRDFHRFSGLTVRRLGGA